MGNGGFISSPKDALVLFAKHSVLKLEGLRFRAGTPLYETPVHVLKCPDHAVKLPAPLLRLSLLPRQATKAGDGFYGMEKSAVWI